MADFKPRISYGGTPTVITFALPPEGDPWNEKNTTIGALSTASSGIQQYNQLYQEEIRKVKLTFVSETLTNSFRTFFEDWGSLKKEFTYYPHGDASTDSGTFTLMDDTFEPNRILPDGSGDFVYEFDFTLRRVK